MKGQKSRQFVLPFSSQAEILVSGFGAKASRVAQLYALKKKTGWQVPNGFAIHVDVYEQMVCTGKKVRR